MRGKPLFIVFEGIDGSGKTSQIELLARHIRAKDKYQDVLLTREPTWRSTELQEKLCVEGDAFSDGARMAYLFVEDRKIHTHNQIIPALEQKSFVLCDRYAMSTCAYQSAQGVPIDKLLAYHESAITRTSDITFYVSVPREVAEQRMIKRGAPRERFEKNTNFTDLLIAQYNWLAVQSFSDERVKNVIGPVVQIDGSQSIDDVELDVIEAFEALKPSTPSL